MEVFFERPELCSLLVARFAWSRTWSSTSASRSTLLTWSIFVDVSWAVVSASTATTTYSTSSSIIIMIMLVTPRVCGGCRRRSLLEPASISIICVVCLSTSARHGSWTGLLLSLHLLWWCAAVVAATIARCWPSSRCDIFTFPIAFACNVKK